MQYEIIILQYAIVVKGSRGICGLGCRESYFGSEMRGYRWLSGGLGWVSDGFFSSALCLFSISYVVFWLEIFYFGKNAVMPAVRGLLRRDFVGTGSYVDKYAP